MEFNLAYPTLIPEQSLGLLQKINKLFRQIIAKRQHVYKNNELEIIIKNTPVTKPYIDVTHNGWSGPSMYNDSPPESGLGTTLFLVQNSTEPKDTIKIILQFTSDDYSEQTYLKFSFTSNLESITILDGAYKGTILNLVQ